MRSIRKRSIVALPELAGECFDFIYIDGDHRAAPVFMDAHLAWQLLKPQGIMIFDDYEWDLAETPEERPKMAIDLFMDGCSGQFDLLHRGWQVILRKK